MKKLLLTLVLCLIISPAFARDLFVFTRPDGGVSIVVPAPNFLATFCPITPFTGCSESDALAAVRDQAVPGDATDIQFIDSDAVPSDRTFRNAWIQSSGAFSTNMPQARNIHTERMATAIPAEIARLKVEERKERLRGNTAKADDHAAIAIALEALNLNVLATQIANAPNPTALKAIWPVNVPR